MYVVLGVQPGNFRRALHQTRKRHRRAVVLGVHPLSSAAPYLLHLRYVEYLIF